MDSTAVPDSAPGWLHRWSVLLVVLLWPLVWVGSLVTTFDAGMAVPDWPSTYGYNLFLYPWETWVFGPFDLFIEHGHRLLASLIGLIAIVAVGFALWTDPRRWVVGLTIAGLLMTIAQGILGGMRVVLSSNTYAMLHGCGAPLVFSLFCLLAIVTGRWWRGQAGGSNELSVKPSRQHVRKGVSRRLLGFAGLLVLGCYLQLVLGVQVRHVSVTVSTKSFSLMVALHVMLAAVLLAFALFLVLRIGWCGNLALSRPAGLLLGLTAFQIALGLATWVVNYGFPFFQGWGYAAGYLVRAKGFGESMIVCAHVATGYLILAMAVVVWVRLWRVRWIANGHLALSDPEVVA